MSLIVGVVVLGGLLIWLFLPRRGRVAAPEDDTTTPIDYEELEAAERDLKEDRGARSVDEEEEDDWGPGTAR